MMEADALVNVIVIWCNRRDINDINWHSVQAIFNVIPPLNKIPRALALGGFDVTLATLTIIPHCLILNQFCC